MRPRFPLPAVHPLLLPLLLAGALLPACATLPEARWDTAQSARVLVLPPDLPVYRGEAYQRDPLKSERVSRAVGEAAVAVWRRKGYQVEAYALPAKAIGAEPGLGGAWAAVRDAAPGLWAGRGQRLAEAGTLAAAFSADLVVVVWGRGEYRDDMFGGGGVGGAMRGKETDGDAGLRSALHIEYVVLDATGAPLLRNPVEELPYSEKAEALVEQLFGAFARVPARK